MLTGGCLCGGVRYEVSAPPMFMAHCHCGECRKWSGAAHSTNVGVPPAQFRIVQGTDLLRPYRHEDRKDIGFCSRCGSSLFTTNDWDAPTEASGINIRAGTLDDDPGVRPLFHIYVGSKAPWHEITDDLPQYEEMFG